MTKTTPTPRAALAVFPPLGDRGAVKPRSYQYDGNGNPLHYEEDRSFRSMVWDEENRLRGINDNGRLHLYTYDHTGERVMKSSAESSLTLINGATTAVVAHNEDYTAYISPYFVVQKGKFTKHYFEGSSRIVSKLGEGTFSQNSQRITAGGIDYKARTRKEQEARDEYIKGLNTPPGPPTQHGIYASPEWTGEPYPSISWSDISQNTEPPEGWPRPPKFNEPGDVPGPPVQYGEAITNANVKAGFNFIPNGVEEKNLYFYHPDHLGSSSYITDKNGEVIQHTEYIAFGEVLVDEHSTSIKQPYLFNGKELDFETGLYYYGARYYDPKTSIFLNVDPLVEKTMTPYAYVNNNPINLIDPTGMEAEAVCCPPVPAPIPLLPPPVLHSPEQGVVTTGTPISLPSKENIKEGFDRIKNTTIFYIASKVIEIEQGLKNVKEGFDTIKSLGERVLNNDDNSSQKAVKKGGGNKNKEIKKKNTKESSYGQEAEHKKGARPSTKTKHEQGQARKGRDKGGEKGDLRRKRYK